ncbi:MAG: EAL domain-containing protein [Oscillospiraceae bacterium]
MADDNGKRPSTINPRELARNLRQKDADTPSPKAVLVVDDNSVNRRILSKILSEKYTVLEAENGQEALKLLRENQDLIAAMMLDLVMPVLDGYAVLEAIRENDRHANLPVLVTTGSDNHDNERKALSLGAWDFVTKPYDAEIILFRLKNAIDRSQLSALRELKYLADYDALTGIYNKTKFFDATRAMLDASPGESFVFLRFDVDRFQLINSFFGLAEGDKLLIYIADRMAEDAKKCDKATYGRIESDVVAMCVPYHREQVECMVCESKNTLAQFNQNYDIVPSIGIYIIDDPSLPIEEMYNRATLAAKTCKGSYVDLFAYYNESMSTSLEREQEITNDMNFALEHGQFEIYLQPKYNIHTNLPCGAEALVRWMHPEKGMISPGDFIPVFERNGFITKLDYYVWEQVCRCLQRWLLRGITPYPISVNVSRVNIYNPNLAETLLKLVERYGLEPSLLNLELTESAYTDNPTAMKKTMARLQSHGFTIMMDDFGSGYSSLSLLKDIMIDVLKIDMRFLSVSEFPGRGENIIASIIRMAKWLNIPVVAEGAETGEQVDFLRSVGCDFVQGYYYARPMPVEEYEQLCINLSLDLQMMVDKKSDSYCYDNLFSRNEEMKRLFNNKLQAAVICEYYDDKIELVRVNEAYYALVGHDAVMTKSANVLDAMESDCREPLLRAFYACARTTEAAQCEYMRRRANGTPLWIDAKLRYVSTVGNKHIIIVELTDITMRKGIDAELQKYKDFMLALEHDSRTVLIVDDGEINRMVLEKILHERFYCLMAKNGREAIKILEERQNRVDLILLDISMPVMDGREFLKYKQNLTELSAIPVIMITADDSPEQQTATFSLGANDYIVKPFIPEVVIRRVGNVLEANHRFKEMVREYNSMSAQIKTDLMTGLMNRVSAEEMIARRLKSESGTSVMIMLDIDNFKQINDTKGHDYGDKVICAVAERLRMHFRKNDVIARMGGDEFAAFVCNIPDLELLEKKSRQLCEDISDIKIDGINAMITCSVGLAVSSEIENSFELLYHHADKALYNAKCRGRNIVSVYGEETADTSVAKWMNDAESVLEAIRDSVYVCDKNTYELIYTNNSLCKLMDIEREECKGKKCHEVLMHRTEPCEFCSMPTMEEGKIYTRLFRTPATSRVFLMHGENMRRNGTVIHLEVAVDVTGVDEKNLHWSEVSGYEKQ